MPHVFSLLEAAHHFERLAHGFPHACHQALEIAAQFVEAEAKRAIGTYKYGWRQLSPATQTDRVAHGFSANEPLMRTGEMRDSIEHCSSPTEARIGSNNDKAVWHELGTSRIPPRPFLANALHQNEKVIVKIVGQTVRDFLAAEQMNADFARLAIEAFRKISESLRGVADELRNDPDEPQHRRR
jgi:phage gpG-like protein